MERGMTFRSRCAHVSHLGGDRRGMGILNGIDLNKHTLNEFITALESCCLARSNKIRKLRRWLRKQWPRSKDAPMWSTHKNNCINARIEDWPPPSPPPGALFPNACLEHEKQLRLCSRAFSWLGIAGKESGHSRLYTRIYLVCTN